MSISALFSRRHLLLALLLSPLLLSFQVQADPAKRLRIGITLHPYYSYVANIVGDKAEVVPLIPAGFNPHAYEPRAEDIKRMDLSKLREGQREGAVKDVRANLLLEKIAGEEGITVSDEDLDKEITAAALQGRQNPALLRQQLEERNGLDALRSQLRCDRALDALLKQSE